MSDSTSPLPQVIIYTDGGADPNPGPGGWGAVLLFGDQKRELSGGEEQTTNNRMELTAALEALRALGQACQVELYTDSEYLKNGITKWLSGWAKKGWLDSKGEPVKNADLWQALQPVVRQHQIEWHWVRGHTGNEHNERAHVLASASIPRQTFTAQADLTQVYLQTSGAESGVGRCGWAARIIRGGGEEILQGRHAQMGINGFAVYAILEILRQLGPDEPLQIFTTNAYLHDGAKSWLPGWKAGGWQKPEKFKSEWQAMDAALSGRSVQWVKAKIKDFPHGFHNLEKLAQVARDSR